MNDNKPSNEHLASFLYDTEKLQTISSPNVIKQGLLYFKENRVTEMDFDDYRLWAYVEGTKADEPYYVELSYAQTEEESDDHLYVQCNCTSSAEPVCKHAIALLYHYAELSDQEGGELKTAQATAVAERVKKGRTEVNVKHLSGKPAFGEWEAASLVSTTHRPQTYKVNIRSLTERMNYCSCPDYASNLLGTCKHIEAVLHKLKKSTKKSALLTLENKNIAFVYLSWDEAEAPKVRVWRAVEVSAELSEILDQYFNAAGEFKAQLPDDFFRFSDQVNTLDNLQIGEDVNLYIRKLMEDISHQAKAVQIQQQITQSNGVLPNIRARLYPYQVEGVAFLASRGRALLADDMGLGKTLQAISAAAWLKDNAAINCVLIICPASLKHQWAREIEKFTAMDTQIIQGGPDVRHVQYRNKNTFLIVNYELVMRDLSLINEIVRPDLIILDEAQRIKNWRTKIASTIKLINSRYAFILTGTPMENRLEDLYSLLQVVDARILGPLWRYMIDYHITDERDKVLGYRNLSKLRQTIAPVLLRRERSLVRDQLPDKTQIRLDVPLTAMQRDLHDSAMSSAGSLAVIAKRRPLTPSESNRLMSNLQQARMACDAAGLVDKETVGSPKLEEVANLLEDLCIENGHKVVIFSQWERMTAMTESVVKKLNLGCVRLHGGVPTAKRGDLIGRFSKDDSISVFISTDAGATGLNLQCATVLINLDVPWNPAVLEQRNARIHRLGQKEKVQIILMVSEDSYEEKVLGLLQNKQNLFDNVIEPDATEDVVGINKKMLATIVEDLGEAKEKTQDAVTETAPENILQEPLAESIAEVADKAVSISAPQNSELDTHQLAFQDDAVNQCIIKIQENLGSRLEKITAGDGGFLVVVDALHNNDEELAETLSQEIPVVIIDHRTMKGLLRLGQSSPVANTTTLFDSNEVETTKPIESPLLELSRRKLKSAEILIEQQCHSDAMGLLGAAMLNQIAGNAGLSQAPVPEQASVWLYGEAMPQGIVNNEQVTAILRAMSLSQAQTIPDTLLYEVLEDARSLVNTG